MKAGTKFIIGGAFVLGTAGYLMASSTAKTATYYLTPAELAAKVGEDPSFYGTGVKVGARVVPGTIRKATGGREVAFRMTDGTREYPVVYKGIIPDTFTDSVDVVVEGRLNQAGTFEATVLLAKCASRYENAPGRPGGYQGGGYRDAPGGYRNAPQERAPATTGAGA